MTVEEKSGKILAELGVHDEAGVRALFQEVQTVIEAERDALLSQGATTEAEREKQAKLLRDRWLARKHGILPGVDEHWLKTAPRELKPAVGREFNRLRQAAAALEVAELVSAIPLRKTKRAVRETVLDLTLPGYRR